MTVDLQLMIDEQSKLQAALGGDHPSTRSPEEQMNYLKEMVLACTDELHEALAETQWKTWAKGHDINRDAYTSELVDALQFLLNLFNLVHCDAEEIAFKLARKHEINWRRLVEGTNGKNKCQNCKRALDDPAVTCTPTRCQEEAA